MSQSCVDMSKDSWLMTS